MRGLELRYFASFLFGKRNYSKMWTFGFGSNMSVANVENKKGHKVLDHEVGVVKGYKMCFNIGAMSKVEPAFANAIKASENDEIHGVAIKISEEDMAALDAQERAYDKIAVTVEGYSGRKIENCSMYTNTKANFLPLERQTPSSRYLNLLIRGALEADLNQGYIEKLRATKTYVANDETKAIRKALPQPESLQPFTVEQLFATKSESLGTQTDTGMKSGEHAYVAVLGYVIKMPRNKCFFSSHLGRDLSARSLRHFRGEPLDKNDDMGRPPYPILDKIKPEEVEYLYNWLDHYLEKGEVIGFVTEYLEQLSQ